MKTLRGYICELIDSELREETQSDLSEAQHSGQKPKKAPGRDGFPTHAYDDTGAKYNVISQGSEVRHFTALFGALGLNEREFERNDTP